MDDNSAPRIAYSEDSEVSRVDGGFCDICDLADSHAAEDTPRLSSHSFTDDPQVQSREAIGLRNSSLVVDEMSSGSQMTFDLMEAAAEGGQLHEFRIREALLRLEDKRDVVMNQLWLLPDELEEELQLDEVDHVRELFMAHPAPHPLLKEAFEMVELTTVRVLAKTARRFQTRIEQLNDRIARDSRAIHEFGGWREEYDEEGKICYVNEEGLRRMDLPAEWWNEEVDRERRFEENHLAIINTEEFVISRVENLLSEIDEDTKKCEKIVQEIERELEKHQPTEDLYEDLVDARNLVVGIVENKSKMVLDFFEYEAPSAIPEIPSVGVTNAYSQRRLRSRPNFRQELEEFFDDEEDLA